MKHTPGPYRVVTTAMHPHHEIWAGSTRLASMADYHNGEEKPTAVLMAAAPDMLDALQAIRNDCAAWLDGEMDSLTHGELLQAFASVADAALP